MRLATRLTDTTVPDAPMPHWSAMHTPALAIVGIGFCSLIVTCVVYAALQRFHMRAISGVQTVLWVVTIAGMLFGSIALGFAGVSGTRVAAMVIITILFAAAMVGISYAQTIDEDRRILWQIAWLIVFTSAAVAMLVWLV